MISFLFGFFTPSIPKPFLPRSRTVARQPAQLMADGALPVGSVPIDRLPRCELLATAQNGDGEVAGEEKSIAA